MASFLDQWRGFVEQSCGELQRAVSGQLDNLCAAADTLCEGLGADAELFTQRDGELERDLQHIEQEAGALRAEVTAAVNQYKTEEAKARNDVLALKQRALDTAKKTIAMHKDVRHHSSKQHNQELLKALKEM